MTRPSPPPPVPAAPDATRVAAELPRHPPREVAILMLSALGDAVHVLPVVNALKRAWPATRITWILQPLAHRLVRDHPAVDDFIVFERRRGAAAAGAFLDARRRLRRRRFDLLLALQVYAKAGLLAWFARADVKLGFDRARARDLNWLVTTHRIPPHPVQHVQDQYFEFVRWLGVSPEPVAWRVPISADERADQQAFFDRFDRPTCAVVVGTSKEEKNWRPDGYARVLDALDRDLGVQPILVGGPSTIERAMAAHIRQATACAPVDMLGDDLRRLVWLLDGADLALSPDTGPLHLARALETPVVGLYGYTNPKRYGPYRKYEELVVDGYARYPDEPYPPSMKHRRDGMSRVRVEDVLAKLELALARYVRGEPGA